MPLCVPNPSQPTETPAGPLATRLLAGDLVTARGLDADDVRPEILTAILAGAGAGASGDGAAAATGGTRLARLRTRLGHSLQARWQRLAEWPGPGAGEQPHDHFV